MEDTKPIKKTGRPRKEPPPGAALLIRELSSNGHGRLAIAKHLKTSKETLNRWMEENEEIKEAFEEGRGIEHKILLDATLNMAKNGNVAAAIFLLKTRHGYRENAAPETESRVKIEMILPKAMSVSDFRVIEGEKCS